MATEIFRNTLEDIQKSFRKPGGKAPNQNISFSRMAVRLSQDHAQEFLKKLTDLTEEFVALDDDIGGDDNINTFGFTYAFFPIVEDMND